MWIAWVRECSSEPSNCEQRTIIGWTWIVFDLNDSQVLAIWSKVSVNVGSTSTTPVRMGERKRYTSCKTTTRIIKWSRQKISLSIGWKIRFDKLLGIFLSFRARNHWSSCQTINQRRLSGSS